MGSLGKLLIRFVAVVAALTAVALAGLVPGAQTLHAATTITVDCTDDAAALAGALASANDGDTLAIQGTCKGTFEIAHNLTLTGSGGATLDGQATDTVLTVDSGKTVVVADLTVTDGFAISGFPDGASGGGIYNFGGTLTLTNSTVSGNTGGGGIVNRATATLTNSTVSGGSGGGIWNIGTLTLTNGTVSGNTAGFSPGNENGGGLYNLGTLTVANSTISANSAVSGGGVFAVLPATLVNTIVAGQTAGGNCVGGGLISDGGYNLEDGTSCGFSTTNNSLPNTNPLLNPAGLRNNGGPTQTIALRAGSSAINAIPTGVNGCGATLTSDQRGVSRPQGPECDIGAFELLALPVAPSSLVATALSRSQVGLVWVDNASTEASFRIERSFDGSSGWRQFSTVAANVTAFTHSRQTPLTTYFYRARATNEAGDSTSSNVATATTLGW